jgi:hypothetical protein
MLQSNPTSIADFTFKQKERAVKIWQSQKIAQHFFSIAFKHKSVHGVPLGEKYPNPKWKSQRVYDHHQPEDYAI